MYPTNDSYGNAQILAAYAGLPEPLFAPTIPGYLQPSIDAPAPEDAHRPGVPAFVWGRAARLRRQRRGLRNHTLIGAPWLYLLELERAETIPRPPVPESMRPEPFDPGETLYFPHHGIGGAHAAATRADDLRVQAAAGTVTVALTREQAASDETVEAYTSVGARVVDLGLTRPEVGAIEPCHLVRLLDLMRAHRRVRTDDASAFALFAHAAGIPVASGLPGADIADLAQRELGGEFLVPAQELRALFDWSNHV